MIELQRMIEAAFERRAEFNPATAPVALCEAVQEALDLLELGKARVAEPCNEGWVVNAWLKKAVLLSFRLNDSVIIRNGYTNQVLGIRRKRLPSGWGSCCAACRCSAWFLHCARRGADAVLR